jgi:hypothetical protein
LPSSVELRSMLMTPGTLVSASGLFELDFGGGARDPLESLLVRPP